MSRLANNALLNIGGFFVEFLGTLVILPYVIGKIGLESYGMVTAIIAITFMGQMLGQAATAAIVRQVSRLHTVLDPRPSLRQEIPQIDFAIIVLAVLGFGSGAVIHFYGDALLAWLDVPSDMAGVAKRSVGFLKHLLPMVLLSNVFSSILRGREKFRAANLLKISVVFVRLVLIVVVFEILEAGIFPFVVIRTSSIVAEGLIALALILWWDRHVERPVEPGRYEWNESKGKQYGLVATLMVYAVGNMIVLEVTKIGVGNVFGLAILGVMGAAATASGFVSRLAQAGSLVLNPAISGLDVNNQTETADTLAYRGTLIGVIVVGSVTIANLAGWEFLISVWLGSQFQEYWLVMGLIFAGQGTVSGIAPLVQSSYGRGQVIGISMIHVLASSVGIGVAYWLGKSGVVGFGGFIGIVAGVRVVGVLANIVYSGKRVFHHIGLRRWFAVCSLILLAWLCGGAGILLGRIFDFHGIAGLGLAVIFVALFNWLAYSFLVPMEDRKFVYSRFLSKRPS